VPHFPMLRATSGIRHSTRDTSGRQVPPARSSSVRPHDAAALDPAPPRRVDTGPSGFIDQANGAFLVVQLAAGAPDLGQFNVAVPGLGLFVSIDRAQVTVNSASSVQLAYSWATYLDSGAVLDSMSAYLTEPSGQLAPVQVGLVADLHPEALTGTVTLTYARQQYAVAADPAPHTADPLLNQIITVITQQNWA